MRRLMFHFSGMALLLVWDGVILTVREKRSLFGNTGRSNAQLGAGHVSRFFCHGAQSGGFSAGDGYQSVDIVSFFMVEAFEGAGNTAARSSSYQRTRRHVDAARFRIPTAGDELAAALQHELRLV